MHLYFSAIVETIGFFRYIKTQDIRIRKVIIIYVTQYLLGKKQNWLLFIFTCIIIFA